VTTALPTLLLSTILLALEVAHVRLLSYTIDPRFVYGAISIAMAGLGGASLRVALQPSLAEGDVGPRVARACVALAGAVLLSSLGLALTTPSFAADSFLSLLLLGVPVLALAALPYLPGGYALALLLASSGPALHRTYAANLVGSALGCFAIYPLLRVVGLEAELVALAALALLTAALVAGPSRLRQGALVLAVLFVPLAATAPRWLVFRPDPNDLLGLATRTFLKTHPEAPRSFQPRREFAGWDPVSRVEVYSFPGSFGTLNREVPIKLLTQDGGAGSILIAFGENEDARSAWAERSVYGAGYLVYPRPERALVVGVGGGVDVVTALHHGARRVTAVEINGTMIDASKNRFGGFQGDVLSRPGVRVVHADGRSFLEEAERRGERWPFIQMSGADTYSAGGGGAFMFSESYLYTVDAFRRYLRLLDDDGVLALIRFGPEPLRAVLSEAMALRELGVTELSRHFLVVRQGICYGIVASRRPLGPEDLERLRGAMKATREGTRVELPMWDAMGFGINEPLALEYAPGLTPQSPFQAVLGLVERGDQAGLRRWLDAQPLDYSPTTDDRPFFFQFLKAGDWPRVLELGDRNFFAAGLLGHLRLVLVFMGMTALLTLAPLALARRRGAALPVGGWPLPYFGALGAAYMLVELTLIQRTVLLLGHPTYSVSVTLCALLLGSGLGAALTGPTRLGARPQRAVGLAAGFIGAWLLLLELVLPGLVGALLVQPLAVRGLGLGLVLLPLGAAMGVPFPVGLAQVEQRRGRGAMAFGLGLNGFASVLTSLVAVMAAMLTGFRALLLVAAVLYGVAALLLWRGAGDEARDG
jgi:SAM-dependent methyltransferase